MSLGSQKKESKSLDKSLSKRLRKRLSLLKRDNATKFSPLSISQCNHEKVEKASGGSRTRSWFCVRAHLPNCFLHTHTTLNSSLVELKLKKVMCTYRNLGIFMSSASSPFRPQVNSLRISLWPYPADLTLARTNHVEEFKLKGFQLCKHKLVFTFKIPLSMTESICLM